MSIGIHFPPEMIERARKLFMDGLSPSKISKQISQEFNVVCRPSTIAHWSDKEGWLIKRVATYEKAYARVVVKKEDSVAKEIENQIEAYRLVQQKALDSLQGEHSLEFTNAMDASRAIDMGIQGERKIASGILGMQFIQDILQILLDEIKDEQVLNRVAIKLKKLAVDLTNK